ncbi:hypothetical protein FB559_3371 [Actinoallomurus bryophytorum]|uniref:Uncharacterized protein n=1 Tax=Actinoallomurus bryophytorum TaxID=1490222 RepID=A0A543CKY4_9ACTN|nr:hypothetical protein FB559_3371 [Actinoallomurus bryophytorum]
MTLANVLGWGSGAATAQRELERFRPTPSASV